MPTYGVYSSLHCTVVVGVGWKKMLDSKTLTNGSQTLLSIGSRPT